MPVNPYRICDDIAVFPVSIRRLITTEDTEDGWAVDTERNRTLYFGVRADKQMLGEAAFWLETDGIPVFAHDDPERLAGFLAGLADDNGIESPLLDCVCAGACRLSEAITTIRRDYLDNDSFEDNLDRWDALADAAVDFARNSSTVRPGRRRRTPSQTSDEFMKAARLSFGRKMDMTLCGGAPEYYARTHEERWANMSYEEAKEAVLDELEELFVELPDYVQDKVDGLSDNAAGGASWGCRVFDAWEQSGGFGPFYTME